MATIKDIFIRKDKSIVIETPDKVSVLHPDGKGVTVDKKTGKIDK